MAMFIPPMISATVVFQRSQDPRQIIRQIKTRRISVLVSVPKILDVLKSYVEAELPETRTPAPRRAKNFPAAGGVYRRAHALLRHEVLELHRLAEPRSTPILKPTGPTSAGALIQGYGLTEAAPIVTLNHPFHSRRGTVGKPIGGVEIRIAEDGEVLVRGRQRHLRLLQRPAATAEAFAGRLVPLRRHRRGSTPPATC